MKKYLVYIMRKIAKLYYGLFSKVEPKKIVFINFNGKGYGDNPKYIAQELINQKKKYDFVWLADPNQNCFPNEIRVVSQSSLRSIYEKNTAHIIVTNVKNDLEIIKKKKQYIIQTWHGGFGVKYVEKDAEDVLAKSYILESKHNSKITDLFISNSSYLSKEYRESFWCTCEIMECGFPRNDILFTSKDKKDEIKQRVFDYYGLSKNKRILLYAPTFRDDRSVDCYNVNFQSIIDRCSDMVILIRMHPNMIDHDSMFDYSENIIDVTDYSDIQELVIACDILITDYSSTMFDFAMLNKPVFIFASDVEKYNKTRGLKSVFWQLPFPISQTNEELLYSILNFDPVEYSKKLRFFLDTYKSFDDGNAAIRIANHISQLLDR